MTLTTSEVERYAIVRAVTDICLDNGGVTKPMADKLADYVQSYTKEREFALLERLEGQQAICYDCSHDNELDLDEPVPYIPLSAIEKEKKNYE